MNNIKRNITKMPTKYIQFIAQISLILFMECTYYNKNGDYSVAEDYKGKKTELNSLGLAKFNFIGSTPIPQTTYQKLLSEIQTQIAFGCHKLILFKSISISDTLLDKIYRVPIKHNLVFGDFNPNVLLFVNFCSFDITIQHDIKNNIENSSIRVGNNLPDINYKTTNQSVYSNAFISCTFEFTFWDNNKGLVIYSGRAAGKKEALDYNPYKKRSNSFCEADSIYAFSDALSKVMVKSPFNNDPFEDFENQLKKYGK
jgi:hypothetical protein